VPVGAATVCVALAVAVTGGAVVTVAVAVLGGALVTVAVGVGLRWLSSEPQPLTTTSAAATAMPRNV